MAEGASADQGGGGITYMEVRTDYVRASDGVGQEGGRGRRRPGAGAVNRRERLRPIGFFDFLQFRGNSAERFLPGYSRPLAAAPLPHPSHRVFQPIRMVERLGLGLAFHAYKTPGEGMLRVGRNLRDLSVRNMDQDPAFTVGGLAARADYFFHLTFLRSRIFRITGLGDRMVMGSLPGANIPPAARHVMGAYTPMRRRISSGFPRRSFGLPSNGMPPVDQVDAAGQRQRDLRILLHEQDGGALGVDGLEDFPELPDDQRHQPLGRLVDQHQRGLGDEAPGDGQHLLFPPGEGLPPLIQPLAQPGEKPESVLQARRRPHFALRGIEHRELEVLQDREVSEDPPLFRNPGDAAGGPPGAAASPEISWPSKVIRPPCGGTIPMMLFSVVVFPAPLRPRRATASPCSTRSERPWRMWLSP